MSRLTVTVAGSRVTMVGRIDDSCSLGEAAALVPAGGATIDTSGVTFINSIGMREWMRFVRALRDKGPVTVERVADVLMTQLNMFSEMAASVTVTSFHAQYACAACGAESTPLIDAVANAQTLRALVAPKLPCPECGSPMDLADFPERYLTIFKST
jgi:hypothetical protein